MLPTLTLETEDSDVSFVSYSHLPTRIQQRAKDFMFPPLIILEDNERQDLVHIPIAGAPVVPMIALVRADGYRAPTDGLFELENTRIAVGVTKRDFENHFRQSVSGVITVKSPTRILHTLESESIDASEQEMFFGKATCFCFIGLEENGLAMPWSELQFRQLTTAKKYHSCFLTLRCLPKISNGAVHPDSLLLFLY